jgi:hypothetical protein
VRAGSSLAGSFLAGSLLVGSFLAGSLLVGSEAGGGAVEAVGPVGAVVSGA